MLPEKWFICQQGLNDIIRFSSYEENSNGAKKYGKFLEFVHKNIKLRDPGQFSLTLDKFQPILIDLSTGEWEVFKPEKENLRDVKITFTPEEKKQKPSIINNTKNLIKKLTSGKSVYDQRT